MLDSIKDTVSAVLVLYKPLDNVLILDLHIDRLIKHPFHVIDLLFLNFSEIDCLHPSLSHLFKFAFLFQNVITIFLSLSFNLPKLFTYLKMTAL